MTPNEMLSTQDRVDAAFLEKRLSVATYTNGWTLWFYRSPAIADITMANYFGPVSDAMATGDHIHISAPDGNAILAVESADNGVVMVRKMVG